MSGISSISNFFNSSQNASGSGSIFSSMNDSRMIKSGAYKKLMKSYYDTVETDNTAKSSSSTSKSRHANSYTYDAKANSSSADKSSSSSSSSSASTSKSRHACTYTYDPQRSTISTVRNKVLDNLLDKSEKKKTTSTNSVLNELLKKDEERQAAKKAAEGTVTEKTETTANGSEVTEATAGAVIDESV